jgi:outer membrane protein TolC
VRRAVLSAALAIGLAPLAAHAQEAPAPAVPAAAPAGRDLTLDQALAAARRANRSLAVDRAKLAGVRTNIEQAWAALFPVISANGKFTRNYKEADLDFSQLFKAEGVMTNPPIGSKGLNVVILKQNQLDANVNGSMPLLAPAAYFGLDAVKKNVASAEATYEASEGSILLSVAQTFYLAAATDEVLVSRQTDIQVATATLENAKTRFAAGTVTKVDVDRAELALVRAEQAMRDAIYAHQQSYRALSTLIQADAPFTVRPPELPTGTPTEGIDTALKLRPEFRAVSLTAASADATRKAYAWRWSPTLSAFGNAHIGNYVGFTGDDYNWAVGLQLDWTIFDGGVRDAQRHQAAWAAAQAEAQALVLADSIRDDLDNGRQLLATRRDALTAAIRAVTLSQETLGLVRDQYEAGTATQIDLLQAQDNLVLAQEALARSRFDVATADVNLRYAAGTFPGK